MTATPRPTAAVTEAGVSGLDAARVLGATPDVAHYESDVRLGGHAHTHDVPSGDRSLRIDTGFIVHDERTGPHLVRPMTGLPLHGPGTLPVTVWVAA